MPDIRRLVTARAALAVALAVAWLNFLLTVKWALLPGALNGWKRPWYGAALVAATLLTFAPRREEGAVRLRGLPWLVAGACVLLGGAYLASFPPSSWHLLPFFDDWVPRYQSTVDGVRLLRRGAVVGWQWGFLGGYQTSADLTQSLTVLGALPMILAGDRLGFHLLHLLLVAGIPFFVYVDIAAEGPPSRERFGEARRRDLALLSAFFALICTVGMFGTIVPSGDTNSIAGVFTAMIAIVGSRMARLGKRWGGAILVLGLTLALYSHGAFFLYAGIFLLLEAVFYRDWRMAVRSAVAGGVAVVASLPQYIEMLRYPEFFVRNNLVYEKTPVEWLNVARQVFYNVEILLHPHRWFNDYLALTAVFLVLFIWLACRPGQSRPRFYAWMVLAAMALFRLNVVESGYLFARVMHMLVPLAPVPLAWFVLDDTNDRRLAWVLVALFALYPQTSLDPIPHVNHVREFDPALVDRLTALDGHLVLLENSPHRDLDRDPVGRTERTPFPAHFEAFLPEATGKRFYGQLWDTWHWTPFRGQVVAGGSFRGQAMAKTGALDFIAEMKKWGIRHLVVWSQATRQFLDSDPATFVRRWQNGRWVHYELAGADTRTVVAGAGEGRLTAADPLEAEVHLSRMVRGGNVVVRANYFPAWTARVADREVALFASNGQLAFAAPDDGDYVVRLSYPRRPWLIAFAVASLVFGAFLVSRLCVIPSSRSAAA
jgi:hypothetical protein